jgi:hypothetical protein
MRAAGKSGRTRTAVRPAGSIPNASFWAGGSGSRTATRFSQAQSPCVAELTRGSTLRQLLTRRPSSTARSRYLRSAANCSVGTSRPRRSKALPADSAPRRDAASVASPCVTSNADCPAESLRGCFCPARVMSDLRSSRPGADRQVPGGTDGDSSRTADLCDAARGGGSPRCFREDDQTTHRRRRHPCLPLRSRIDSDPPQGPRGFSKASSIRPPASHRRCEIGLVTRRIWAESG